MEEEEEVKVECLGRSRGCVCILGMPFKMGSGGRRVINVNFSEFKEITSCIFTQNFTHFYEVLIEVSISRD